ncbi:DUF4190 domain-containing protein [Amnibacterium sp.]|uniref:DUF4190 domain-containing protein n=1 Tax=Amnibacterium sp. TaxID=1872496 RepID=UPI003F7B94CE
MTSAPVTPTSTSTTTNASAKLNGLALAGFIVALVGLVLFFTTWIGGLIALVGAILSIVGKVQVRRRGERGNGLAIAGTIIGISGVVLAIIYTSVIVAAVLPQLQQAH